MLEYARQDDATGNTIVYQPYSHPRRTEVSHIYSIYVVVNVGNLVNIPLIVPHLYTTDISSPYIGRRCSVYDGRDAIIIINPFDMYLVWYESDIIRIVELYQLVSRRLSIIICQEPSERSEIILLFVPFTVVKSPGEEENTLWKECTPLAL